MNNFWPYAAWLAMTVAPLIIALLVGYVRMRSALRNTFSPNLPHPLVEVLIPIKGAYPGQTEILESLVVQDYPNYFITFIVESWEDRANVVLEPLLDRYENVRKVIAGESDACAQKNRNLIVGLSLLRPDTEIIIFCDSTNVAELNWISRMTNSIRSDQTEVTTTFRMFNPESASIPAMCQVIYSGIMLFLASTIPTPWGGGTAIKKSTLERLHIEEDWAHTIVDDLILGNTLKAHGIQITMDPSACLTTPLKDQTVAGYIHYFDRQVMFPKFTNPEIWLCIVFFYSNIALAVINSIVLIVLSIIGYSQASYGLLSVLHIITIIGVILAIRRINPYKKPVWSWVRAIFPCLALNLYVVLRSVYREYIDWHGKRYWPGRKGVVLKITAIDQHRTGI